MVGAQTGTILMGWLVLERRPQFWTQPWIWTRELISGYLKLQEMWSRPREFRWPWLISPPYQSIEKMLIPQFIPFVKTSFWRQNRRLILLCLLIVCIGVSLECPILGTSCSTLISFPDLDIKDFNSVFKKEEEIVSSIKKICSQYLIKLLYVIEYSPLLQTETIVTTPAMITSQ